MLASFPSSQSDPEMVAKGYLFAVDGVDEDSVLRVAMKYVKGTVPNQERRFAPSAAEFSDNCRSDNENIQAAIRLIAKNPARQDDVLRNLSHWAPDAMADVVHSAKRLALTYTAGDDREARDD